jgi:hypothetical protein
VLGTVVIAGCGGGTDQKAAVRAAVVSYGSAVAAKDYTKICNTLLAPNILQQMAAIALPCKTALSHGLGMVVKPTVTVGVVKVTGDSAVASVHTTAANQKPADTTIGLVKFGGTWRVASLTGPAAPSK